MPSLRTVKYAAYHEYLGIENAASLTDEKLEKIENYGTTSWARENCPLSDTEFAKRNAAWWDGERFILHPQIYAGDLKRFMADELPTKMADYVRRRFKASSGRTTKAKAAETVATLNAESPNCGYSSQRGEVFLRRFSQMFPDCVDGQREGPGTQSPKPKAKSTNHPHPEKKVITINLLWVLVLAVVVFALYKILV